MTTFDKVYAAVKLIPRGSVATYGQIAAAIGNKRLARVVGYAIKLTFRIKRGKNYKDYKFLKQQVQE